MRDITDQILNKPRYFYCEKDRRNRRFEVCLGRQKANEARWSKVFDPIPFPACENCKQGAENKFLVEAKLMEQTRPKRGRGKRLEDCEHYKGCLDLAAKNNWKNFNCESCPIYKPDLKKEENTRICEECKEKATISPKHPFCASCLAKKGNEAKKAKKSGVVRSNRRGASQPMGKPEKARRGQNTALTVEFSEKHVSILKEIEELAEEEMRPVGLQVVYMLKKQLDSIKEGQAAS